MSERLWRPRAVWEGGRVSGVTLKTAKAAHTAVDHPSGLASTLLAGWVNASPTPFYHAELKAGNQKADWPTGRLRRTMFKIEIRQPREDVCQACEGTGIVIPEEGEKRIVEVGTFCQCLEGAARWDEVMRTIELANA